MRKRETITFLQPYSAYVGPAGGSSAKLPTEISAKPLMLYRRDRVQIHLPCIGTEKRKNCHGRLSETTASRLAGRLRVGAGRLPRVDLWCSRPLTREGRACRPSPAPSPPTRAVSACSRATVAGTVADWEPVSPPPRTRRCRTSPPCSDRRSGAESSGGRHCRTSCHRRTPPRTSPRH